MATSIAALRRVISVGTQKDRLSRSTTRKEVDGLIAAKELEYKDLPADVVAVEVPDGEVLAVKQNQIKKRPTEIRPPVLEPEFPHHVSV